MPKPRKYCTGCPHLGEPPRDWEVSCFKACYFNPQDPEDIDEMCSCPQTGEDFD